MGDKRPRIAVGAVTVHDGRLLVVRRGRGVAVGRWSLPGGHAEAGETIAQALVREVREETSLRVRVGDLCGVAERTFGEERYLILNYWCVVEGGELHAGDDATEVRWVAAGELASLDLVDRLAEFLTERGVLARLTAP